MMFGNILGNFVVGLFSFFSAHMLMATEAAEQCSDVLPRNPGFMKLWPSVHNTSQQMCKMKVKKRGEEFAAALVGNLKEGVKPLGFEKH